MERCRIKRRENGTVKEIDRGYVKRSVNEKAYHLKPIQIREFSFKK